MTDDDEEKKPLFSVRVDPDVEMTDIYLIPTRRDPDWTDEDVARRSGVIRNVRMPK
jgi:hypothetical protein